MSDMHESGGGSFGGQALSGLQSSSQQNQYARNLLASQQQGGGFYNLGVFRQELDELVKSIIIDKNRARTLPAFEAACRALGYHYDAEECALYRDETTMVPDTKRVKVA